jgi:hypothetical protein
MHDPKEQIRSETRRPARCFRHHKWMAACDDCRDVRAASLVSGGRNGSATAR